MDDLAASDLKTILHSKRANLYYLEHCRVLVNGGRVEYVTERAQQQLYWNIPIANTTTVLLGTGTSITQAAVRELAKAGVMLGFCGGGGTPLFAGTECPQTCLPSVARPPKGDEKPRGGPAVSHEATPEVAWIPPQSEYRPTEYLQHWVRFWFDDGLRLQAAKQFQRARLERLRQHWASSKALKEQGFAPDLPALEALILASAATRYGEFTRAKRTDPKADTTDAANQFLDHGNYLAYGLGATACWVLGLPHGLAVLHGKTRRGGLVFDVADLIKDALILPQAFVSAMKGHSEQEFRQACIEALTRTEVLDFMIDTLKATATELGQQAQAGAGTSAA